MAWAELESSARESLDERAIAYIFGGAGSEDTMRANLDAFRRWRIVPRVLRKDLSMRDLSLELLGTRMPARCSSHRSASRPCSMRRGTPRPGPRLRSACRWSPAPPQPLRSRRSPRRMGQPALVPALLAE